MSELGTDRLVMLIFVGAYSVITMASDLKMRRIPNAVTVPMFVLGLIFQGIFHQWDGILDGLLAFGFSFGTLFLLWLVGGAGGGDAKLLGGLSVWLGWQQTMYVVIASIFYVVIGSMFIILLNVFRKGARKTLTQYQAERSVVETKGKKKSKKAETVEQRQKRRIMPYACPVALATWTVLAVGLVRP